MALPPAAYEFVHTKGGMPMSDSRVRWVDAEEGARCGSCRFEFDEGESVLDGGEGEVYCGHGCRMREREVA